jgi:predicted transcriptional regulator
MTRLLEEALDAVRQLPPENQDEIARLLLRLAKGQEEPEPIDPDHLSAVLEGLRQIRRGEFATDEEVREAFRRFER